MLIALKVREAQEALMDPSELAVWACMDHSVHADGHGVMAGMEAGR